jgi:glycosyltransferase involved in cell wall biosynthesis
VVTTYALQRLPDTQELIDALHSQTYPEIEIIFIGERERELCDRMQTHAAERGIKNLKILFNENTPGLSPSRNLGIRHANGDIIAFTDDHALPRENWIEEIVEAFRRNPSAIGITGQAMPLWEDDSSSWFPQEFYWLFSCTSAINGDKTFQVRNAWGVNMAYRKEAFEMCSFSEDFGVSNKGTVQGIKLGLVGDDTEFGVRVCLTTGRPILLSPAVKVLNKVPKHKLTQHFIRRRAFWEGYTKAVLSKLPRPNQTEKKFSFAHEYMMLARIFLLFFPKNLLRLLTNPVNAVRSLFLGGEVVVLIFLGYFAGRFPKLGATPTRRYSS